MSNLEPPGFCDLLPEIAAASTDVIAGAVDRCRTALAQGEYAAAARSLLDRNAAEMRERKAGR